MVVKFKGILVDAYQSNWKDKLTQEEKSVLSVWVLDPEEKRERIKKLTVKNNAITQEYLQRFLFKPVMVTGNFYSFSQDGVNKSGFTCEGIEQVRE